MSKIGVSILRSAEKILPSCHEDEHRKRQESFQLQVLEPAFDLAVAMKTSSVCYEFTECFTRETQLKTFPMKNYHYDYCTMIDIDTRKSLKKIPKGHNGDKAIGADQVLMLAPGLIRRAGDETKKLTPEMVCVKVDLSAIIDDDDDEPTMKQEDSDPFMMPGPGANVNSGPTDHEPPKKKQKLLKPSLPIDLDSEEEAKTEGNPDRPQRHIKRPIIYGLYPDDGTSGLD